MFPFGQIRSLTESITALKDDIADLKKERKRTEKELELTGTVVDLKKQISELEIKKSKMEESHAREERELRHMIGLEKKRQEFEIQQAKKETALDVREGNLSAEKKRFEDNLKFNSDRFERMETYLKELMEKVLDRLPTVTVDKTISKKG